MYVHIVRQYSQAVKVCVFEKPQLRLVESKKSSIKQIFGSVFFDFIYGKSIDSSAKICYNKLEPLNIFKLLIVFESNDDRYSIKSRDLAANQAETSNNSTKIDRFNWIQ